MMMLAILFALAAGQVHFEAASDSSPSERATETEVYHDPAPLNILYMEVEDAEVASYAAELGYFPDEADLHESQHVRDARQRFHFAASRQPPVTVAQFVPMLVAMQGSTDDNLDVPEGLNARVEQEASVLMRELADCQSAGGAELDAMTQVQRFVQQRLVSAAWIPIARMLITLGRQPDTAEDLSIMVDDGEARRFGAHGAARASSASSSAVTPPVVPRADGPRAPRRGNRKGGFLLRNACHFAGMVSQDGRQAGPRSSSSGRIRLSYPDSFLQRVLRRRSHRSFGFRPCKARRKYGGFALQLGIFTWMLRPLVSLPVLVTLATLAHHMSFSAQFVLQGMPGFFLLFAWTIYTHRRQHSNAADPGPKSGRYTVHSFGRFHLMPLFNSTTRYSISRCTGAEGCRRGQVGGKCGPTTYGETRWPDTTGKTFAQAGGEASWNLGRHMV